MMTPNARAAALKTLLEGVGDEQFIADLARFLSSEQAEAFVCDFCGFELPSDGDEGGAYGDLR